MAIKFSKEQQLAIDSTNQNIIVSAGAGSGKTAVLTQRIKKILLSGVKANQLLVLTFTRLAAMEMKERIIKVMQKDEILKNRLNEVDNAYITTFDSFSLSLVKKYHDYLNVSPQLNIIDKSVINVYKRQVMDEIFNEYYVKNDEKFITFVTSFDAKNDANLKKNILTLADKINNLLDPDEYLNRCINEFYSESTVHEFISEFEQMVEQYVNQIRKLIDENIHLFDEKNAEKINKKFQILLTYQTYDELKRNLMNSFSLKCDDEEQIKVIKSIEICVKKINELAVFSSVKEMKEQYLATKETTKIIVEVLKKFNQRVYQFKEANEAFEFVDVAKMAIHLVKTYPQIKEELKNQFKEILVDEYQDTNDLQEIFIQQIAQNNVYMVGDIKQSIYSFRNANPMLFKNKYDDYKNHQGGMKIDLNQNFRSNRPVLNTVNTIFNRIMDDEIGSANFEKEHQMHFGLKDYEKMPLDHKIKVATYSPLNKKMENQQIEMFYVLNDILTKINNHEMVYDKDLGDFRCATYKDFAILMSDSELFDEVSMILQHEHIPTLIYKNIPLFKGQFALILKNIIKLITLDYQKDYGDIFKGCYYSIARSFLYEMKDEEIFDVLTTQTWQETLLYQQIHELSQLVDSQSLSQIFNQLIEKMNVIQKLIKIGDIDENITRIESFYNLTNSMENLNLTIFDFVTYIDDIQKENETIEFAPSGANENKVKIMTIHKSKGLEFPIVYFMNNQKKFLQLDNKAKFQFSQKYGIIVPFYNHGESRTVPFILNKEKNKIETISEKIRLLYVALTRAREQMIILHQEKEDEQSLSYEGVIPAIFRKKYNSFKEIYQSVLHSLNDCVVLIDVASLNMNDAYLKAQCKDIHQYFDSTEDKITFIQQNILGHEVTKSHASKIRHQLLVEEEEKAMKFGTHIHELFETCDFLHFDETKYSVYERKLLKNFLSSPLMTNKQHAKFYKEFEFIDENDGNEIHGIIDLLVEYDDHLDLIDYKLSNIDDEAYNQQLNVYKNYIAQKTNKPIHIYLYSILTATYKEL